MVACDHVACDGKVIAIAVTRALAHLRVAGHLATHDPADKAS